MSTAESAVAGPWGPADEGAAPASADTGDAGAVRQVFGNAIALVVAYALPRVLTLGAVVLAARILGAAAFGAYAAAGAAAVILSILSTAGMQPLLVREIARDPAAAPALLRAAHRVKTALNALMLGVLGLTAHAVFGLQGEAFWAALWLTAGYAVGSYAENLAAYFQAVERMRVWTAANAAYGIVAGGAGAALIVVTRSLPWFCLAMLLGQLAAVGWLHVAYRRSARAVAGAPGKQLPVDAPAGRMNARGLAMAAAPFAAAFLALTVFYKGDVVLLARLQPAAEAGLYVAAYKLVDVAQALALAAIVATYPRLVRSAAVRSWGERWAASRLAELALLLVVPVAAVAFLLRETIVGALYGPGYHGGVAAAAFLLPALVPLVLNLLAGYVLAAANRMRLMAMLYGAGAAVKLAAVALVVPHQGAAGAAAVMLGAELLLCLGLQLALHRTAHAAAGRRALVAAAAAAGLAVVVALLPGLPPALAGILFIAATVGAYVRLDVLSRHERRVLRATLRPLRFPPRAEGTLP